MEQLPQQIAPIISSVQTWMQFGVFVVIVITGVWYVNHKDKLADYKREVNTQARIEKRDLQVENINNTLEVHRQMFDGINKTLERLECTIGELDKLVAIMEDRSGRPISTALIKRGNNEN